MKKRFRFTALVASLLMLASGVTASASTGSICPDNIRNIFGSSVPCVVAQNDCTDGNCTDLQNILGNCDNNCSDVLGSLIQNGSCNSNDLACLINDGSCSVSDLQDIINQCDDNICNSDDCQTVNGVCSVGDLQEILSQCDCDGDVVKALLDTNCDTDCKVAGVCETVDLEDVIEQCGANTKAVQIIIKPEDCNVVEEESVSDKDCTDGNCNTEECDTDCGDTAEDCTDCETADNVKNILERFGINVDKANNGCNSAKDNNKVVYRMGNISDLQKFFEQFGVKIDSDLPQNTDTESPEVPDSDIPAEDNSQTETPEPSQPIEDNSEPETPANEDVQTDSDKSDNTQKDDTKTDTNTDNKSDSSVSAYEKEVAELVNDIRVSYGLAPLTLNTELSAVARIKSEDMRDSHYFSHTSPNYGTPFEMMKQFGISYRTAGENIAMGQRTPEEVVNAWMNSEGHRANILNSSFTQIGVGYASNGNYWTQMFIG